MVALKWTTLLALLPVYIAATSINVQRNVETPPGPTKLLPITVNRLSGDGGLDRRAAESFSNLDLETQSELIYGTPGGQYEIGKQKRTQLTT